jgi:2-O-methyltransferase
MIRKLKDYFLKRKFREEYQVLQLVKARFNKLDAILEAGGHNGKDTIRISETWPGATVHVFEPEPSLFEQLAKNTAALKNVNIYPVALSDKPGNVVFHISSGKSDGSSSILKPKEHLTAHPDVFFNEEITVTAENLDSWMTENNIVKIDFMWLDMQGFEMQMLKGAPEALKKVSAIYTEVSLIETYEGVPLYPEFRAFLAGHGFVVYQEYLTWKDMGNVLFIRKDLI